MSLSLIMLGTGSPRPTLKRSSPSQLIEYRNERVLIDCGYNTFNQLLKAEIKPEEIKYIFMTHLHADHALDYAHFLITGWVQGRRELTVVGPKGMKAFHEHMLKAFEEDIDYRLSLGRPSDGIRTKVNIIEMSEACSIQTSLPFKKITAAKMVHNVLTFGFRFETEDQVVVVSGDTAPSPSVPILAKDADVLVIDACLAPNRFHNENNTGENQTIWGQLQKEHCTPKQAGQLAQEANVKTLVLTHFLPGVDEEAAWKEAKSVFDGLVIVPEDLQIISITSEIAHSLIK